MIAWSQSEAFPERLEHYRSSVDRRLSFALGNNKIPRQLKQAIEYSVLGPGKRVRPLIAYATGELFDIDQPPLDAIAAAVELVHAYSLVHDDLPAMDNDDLRRGRPTTHRAFGEAVAILAGDGLQALAFEILCCEPSLACRPSKQIKVTAWLANAAGPAGMVGGQTLDIAAEGKCLDEQALEDIHRRKTGALIKAAVMMPTELADIDSGTRRALGRLSMDLGILFQIRDDLLEIEQDTATLGKNTASDSINRKSTYPSVLGVTAARERADALHARTTSALEALGPKAAALRWLTDFIHGRAS